jgi:tetratricopeptide (TPR) repeat protein
MRCIVSRTLLLTLVLAAAAAALAQSVGPRAPEPPALIVPARPDSVTTETEPAPLIVPGRPGPRDSTLKSPRETAREQFALAQAMEEAGNIPAAVLAYHNAARLDTTMRDAFYRIGLLLVPRGDPRAAMQAFTEEIRRHPDHTDARRERGLALIQLGRPSQAIKELEALTKKEPQRDVNWYALGVAQLSAKQYVPAEASLRRAIALGPKRSDEHRDLGVVLAARGRTTEARAEYRKALALNPRDAATWVNLGNLQSRAGQPDSAWAAYVHATEADSSFAPAYQAQLNWLRQAGRENEMGSVYRDWVRVRPDDLDLRLEAVRYFNDHGRSDLSVELARDGVRRNRRSPDAHLILGMALESSGESRAALRELRTAESLYRAPESRTRVRSMITAMRAAAPDSLRAMFTADSAANLETP